MNVLALLGSPRKGGNSEILADEVLWGAAEAGAGTAKVHLDDLWIRPIAEVMDNRAKREDTRSDDDFPGLLERFLDAQIVVFATPVYWAGVTAQTKCFIDRLSAYAWRPPYAERFKGKGYAVACTFAVKELEHGEWVTKPLQCCVDVLGGRYLGDVCASVYKKGAVREMADALHAARELGAKAVEQMQEPAG